MTLHRDDLIRMVELPTAEVEFRAETEGPTLGTLQGYAAVFDSDTLIDSWEGRFVERMAPGAFAKTLKERGDKIKVLFNHGFDPSIGDKPLGKPRLMEERSQGLWVEVPLDDTTYNRDLVASLRSGALDGMSIRFSVKREDVDDTEDLPVRTVREAKLYEFGPVTFPAYEATTAGVRGRDAYAAWRTAHPGRELSDDTVTLTQRADGSITAGTPNVDNSDADPVTSEESTDTPPQEAPVRNQDTVFAMPVRQVDDEAIRETAASYIRRLEAIERKHHARRA